MTDLENKNKRYRFDANYRQRQIAEVRARHQQQLSNPTYKRLVHVRKKISQRRGQITDCLNKTAKCERELIRLIAERDRLAARLKGQSLASSERAAEKRKCAV